MAETASPQHPTFESPVVRNYPASSGDDLTLTDASATTKWLVRAGADGPTADRLGVRFGTSQAAPSGALVLGSRPGEWTVVGTREQVAQTVASLDNAGDAAPTQRENSGETDRPARDGGPQEFMTALDWTHSRAMFRLTGADAPRLLEKVCGIDWGDHMTPDGAVLSASVALTTCDLARNDVSGNDTDGTPSYLVFCDRSFGQYLFDALIDAGNEFGLTVTAPGR